MHLQKKGEKNRIFYGKPPLILLFSTEGVIVVWSCPKSNRSFGSAKAEPALIKKMQIRLLGYQM